MSLTEKSFTSSKIFIIKADFFDGFLNNVGRYLPRYDATSQVHFLALLVAISGPCY